MDENKTNDIHECSAEPQENKIEKNNDQPSKTLTGKKMAFILGLCLWAYLLYTCIRYGVWMSINRGYLDLFSFIKPIGDLWIDSMLGGHILLGILAICLLAYPFIYISSIREASKEKDSQAVAVDNSEPTTVESDIQASSKSERRFSFSKILFIITIVFIMFAIFILPIMTDTQSISDVLRYYEEDEFVFSLMIISAAYILIYSVVVFLLPKAFGIRLRKYTFWYSIFILSFALYLRIPLAGFFNFGFSIWGNISVYYGFTAMLVVIVWHSIVPIYPFLLTAQIVFYKVSSYHGKLSDLQRTATKRVIQFLLLSSALIGVLSIFGINGELLK